jgi:hypothetical protein
MIIAALGNDAWWCPVKYPCCTYTISLLTLREMNFWEVRDVGLVSHMPDCLAEMLACRHRRTSPHHTLHASRAHLSHPF